MIYDLIADELGWPGFKMTREDAFALHSAILEGGDGNYLEIGVRMGGSAIFAAMVKTAAKQHGDIYGIDSYNDGMRAKGVTPEAALQRARNWGVTLNLTVAMSDPFPLPDLYPVVALIDGSHHYQDCLNDWNNLKDRTKRFILFHDYIPGKSVEGVVEIAKQDKQWRFAAHIGTMAVFERC